MEGLISAARPAVAFVTNLLRVIETADGVLSGTHSYEQLIVASNEVRRDRTARRGVACDVSRANLMSKTQEWLEVAAKAVTEAYKALMKFVCTISAKQVEKEPQGGRGLQKHGGA
jgi:hypothetical protein